MFKLRLYALWVNFLATSRLSAKAVCEQSAGMGLVDHHDYPDSVEGQPWHMCELTCKRCGKKFVI